MVLFHKQGYKVGSPKAHAIKGQFVGLAVYDIKLLYFNKTFRHSFSLQWLWLV